MEEKNNDGSAVGAETLGPEPTLESLRESARKPELSSADRKQIEAAQKEMAKLMSEENWDLILFSPADMRYSLTGNPWWNSEEKERKPIRQSVSVAMKCHFGMNDPKWIATALACVQLTGFYATRIMSDYLHYRREKDEIERKKEKAKGEPNGLS